MKEKNIIFICSRKKHFLKYKWPDFTISICYSHNIYLIPWSSSAGNQNSFSTTSYLYKSCRNVYNFWIRYKYWEHYVNIYHFRWRNQPRIIYSKTHFVVANINLKPCLKAWFASSTNNLGGRHKNYRKNLHNPIKTSYVTA